MGVIPAEVPNPLWDEDEVQAGLLGTLALAEGVTPLGVWTRHKVGMVTDAEHEDVELVVLGCVETDKFVIPKPSEVVWLGVRGACCRRDLPGGGGADGGYQGAGTNHMQDFLDVGEGIVQQGSLDS